MPIFAGGDSIKKHVYTKLVGILFLVAGLSLLSSLIFQIHAGMTPTAYQVFDMSFYHFVPFVLWTLYLPFIFRVAQRWPFPEKRFWYKHFALSLAFALLSRVLAIWIDFAIKHAVGMIDATPSTVLWDVRWVVLASFPKELLIYWLVIFLFSYFARSEPSKPSGKLVFETDQGTLLLMPEQVLCVESARNYIIVHTYDGKYRSRKTLKSILPQLDDQFAQIHRSRIVNKDAVARVIPWRSGEYMLELQNGLHVSSSRSFQDHVKSILSEGAIRPAMA